MESIDEASIPGQPRANTARRVLLLCFIIAMIEGYDLVIPSLTAPLISKAFGIGMREVGEFFSLGYVGIFAGSLVAGQLADFVGRRPIMTAFLAVTAAATLGCAIAPTFTVLLLVRFVAGLGLGGSLPSLFILTAEHSPESGQNARVVLMYVGYPLGAVVGGFITSSLLRSGFGWQGIFVGGGIAALLMVPLALMIPESMPPALKAVAADAGFFSALSRAKVQFAQGRLRAALLMWLGFFCMMMMTYLLVSWTPTMAAKSGLPLSTAALSNVVLSFGGILGALALGPIVSRKGPFAPAATIVGIAALLITLLGYSFGSVPLLMSLLFLVGFTGLGGQLLIPAMGIELFPADVRGTGSGWMMAVGRLGSIAGALLGGALLAARFDVGQLYVVVALSAATAAVSFALAGRVRPSRRAAIVP